MLFDLVITDLTMPSMTGDKLAYELIQIKKNLPVIITSGYARKLTPEQIEHIASKFGLDSHQTLSESPRRKVNLKECRIDRYPVTNFQYKEFVNATDHGPPHFWEGDS